MKRALVIWFFVAALVAMGCSPPPDSFGSVGTLQDSWIEIWDWYDLDAVRNDLSGSYVLMNDIDSTTVGYEEVASPTAHEGKGWVPVGEYDSQGTSLFFTGIFDGQGYEIKDMFIYRPGEVDVGLFGFVYYGAVVKNVGLVNADVTDGSHVGGLAGSTLGSINNCYVTGTVTGYSNVGGLVGRSWGTVSNCYATADVAGMYAGGLIGGNYEGYVYNSHATGSVSGGWAIGGLVAWNSGTVSRSYSTGNVAGTRWVGGLVGNNLGTVSDSYSAGSVTRLSWAYTNVGGFAGENERGKITNCYSTGSVHYDGRADPTNKGFVGEVDTDGEYEMIGNFWDIETSGQSSTAGDATGRTTAEMQDIVTFLAAGWHIETTTLGDPTGGYPFLSWQLGNSPTWLIYEDASPIQCDLAISSIEGGSVSEPGEGMFAYEDGTVVHLVAEAGIGYQFVNWSGDVSTIANVNAPETTITMNGDYSIVANFAVIPPWPMFGQNPQRTGESPYTGPEIPYLRWSFTTLGSVQSSPAVGTDGTIYVGSYDNNLYAVDPDGSEKWQFTTGGLVGSSPTIGPDGTIYVGSRDNNLYAVNPDGSEKWSFMTGNAVYSSPAIGPDGTIYIGSWDNNLYAVNSDGSEKWRFNTGWLHVESSPTIGDDGTIYVGSLHHNLHAIDRDGSEKWSFMTGNAVYSSPAVGADGTIYVGSYDNNLYAVNPDGSEKWRFATSEPVHSSPAIGPDGTIYIGSWDNNLYAVNSDGSEKWRFATGQPVLSSPAIGTDGTIYVGSNDGNFYAVNSDGSEKWRFATGGYVWSSPAIDIDGTIYVGSYDYKLYAITEAPNHTLNIFSSAGGSVTEPGEGGFPYVAGTVVGLVASAYEGYSFVNWSGDADTIADADAAETTITMNDNYSITANFAIDQYTLTYTAGPGGSISGTTPQTVNHGSDGTPVEAVPDTGYHFVDWSDSSTDNPRTDTNVTGDISVTANFAIDEHDLTISSSDGGSVTTPGEGTYLYAYGTVVNLVAAPAMGHDFVNWTGDVGTIDNVNSASTTITMNGDYSIVANFEPVAGVQTQCVESATGTGEVCFTTSHGFIEDLEALPSVPPAPPADIVFPHGMFSFEVTGLSLGQTVIITVELPDPVPVGTRWWKEHMGAWYSIPVTVVEPNIISFTLTDGVFPGDSDNTEDGVITDPGGPGYPLSLGYTVGWETQPINKVAVVAPWIGLLAAIAGASLLVLRRRQTQN